MTVTVGDAVDVLAAVGTMTLGDGVKAGVVGAGVATATVVDVLITVGSAATVDAIEVGVMVGLLGTDVAEIFGSALDSGAMTTGWTAVGARVAVIVLVDVCSAVDVATAEATFVANAATALACGASTVMDVKGGAHPPTISSTAMTETQRTSQSRRCWCSTC